MFRVDILVLCTTTAEALAMGKFVIIPQHISNEYFYSFRNCLTYNGVEECVQKIEYALTELPQPLSEKEVYQCTWVAATHRFLDACTQYSTTLETKEEEKEKKPHTSSSIMTWLHYEVSNQLRQLFCHFISKDQI